jgi:hypothetical protein
MYKYPGLFRNSDGFDPDQKYIFIYTLWLETIITVQKIYIHTVIPGNCHAVSSVC